MAADTEYWMERGRADRKAADSSAPLPATLTPPPKAGSWQREAYDAGYSGTQGAPKPAAIAHPSDEFFKDWPRAAREHVQRLSRDLADERGERRKARLMRAVGRMFRRHAPGVQPFARSAPWH